jgi:threonine dehydratase
MTTGLSPARVDSADVADARRLLTGVARVTPVETCRVLSERLGAPVHLKCENLQRTGSFKLRGAYVRLARLDPARRRAGVVAASAGNHAQGVALAAALLGIQARVYMPRNAPLPKLEATRGYGAEVELVDGGVDDALAQARVAAELSGRTFIHPFDHPDVIAGQATVAAELAEQCPDVDTVLVPVGGGGLISGIAGLLKAQRPGVRMIGVQAEAAAAFSASIAMGAPVVVVPGTTLADGIAVGRPGDLTFEHVRRDVDELVTVTEDAIARAVLLCLERVKLVVEPAGAVGVAALLSGAVSTSGSVGVILTGGNIDPLLTLRVLRHGLSAGGRHLTVRLRLIDRPGELARLLATLAELRVNVREVEQTRGGDSTGLDDVEVCLQLETGGSGHQDETVTALEAAGYLLSP